MQQQYSLLGDGAELGELEVKEDVS